MSTTTPFDILFRNFFDRDLVFLTKNQKKRRSFQEGTSIMVLVRSHLDSAIRSYLNTIYPKLQQIWKTDY